MRSPSSPPLLFLAVLLATGCVKTRAGDGGDPADSRAPGAVLMPTSAPSDGAAGANRAGATAAVQGPLRPGLSVPPGIAPELLTPLEGEALDAARVSLNEFRATLPDPIEAGPADAASDQAEAEPPLQAQRLFARAQQALIDNSQAEAVQMLEAAARLAPGEPRILRELAGGWLALGNRPRAVQHLREAVRRGAAAPDARMLLGQLLVDAGEPEAGLAELLAVLDDEDSDDPALRPLAAFQAARTLAAMGRLNAALELYAVYRDTPRDGMRPSRSASALLDVDRARVGHRVREGDLLLRLDRPAEAAAAYAAAVDAIPSEDGPDGGPGVVRDPQLAGRLVFADLRLGRDDSASEQLVDFARSTSASPASLGLVSWAVEEGLPGGPMVEQLRGLEDAGGGAADPAALTLALAVSLPPDEAVDLLRERQRTAGFEPRVYDALLGLLLRPEASGEGATPAVELVLATLREHPEHGYLAVAAWLRRVGGAEPAAEALAEAGVAAEVDDAAALTLQSVVDRQVAGDAVAGSGADPSPLPADEPGLKTALDRLQRAVELQPDLVLARVERARLLGATGRHDEGLAELDALPDEVEDPRVPRLRVGLLLAAGRQAEAAAALERLVVENPRDATLVLQRAQLLAAAGDAAGAERALLDALSANPKSEPIYAALLRVYDDDRLGPSLPDYPQNYERLRRRIFQEIPESRVARLAAAAYLEASGDNDQARRVLEELLVLSPEDREAQFLLLDVLGQQGDIAGADALVEKMLAERPDDLTTLVAARNHYHGHGGPLDAARDPARHLDILKRLRDLQEPGFARTWSTAQIQLLEDDYPAAADSAIEALPQAGPERVGIALEVLVRATRQMEPADSEPRLRKAIEIAPAFSNQLSFELASVLDGDGRADDAEAALEAALEASPDDAQLNNAVGYRWAYRGIRLDEAERLIGKAVAAEGDNAAYLDSLGWVLYQQGRFEEALRWLNQSRERPGGVNPVILLHVGDTLQRLGRTVDAEPVWRQALSGSVGLDETLDPELVGIADRLKARLDAARAGGAVPVARTAAEPGEAGADVPVDATPEPETEPDLESAPEPGPMTEPQPEAEPAAEADQEPDAAGDPEPRPVSSTEVESSGGDEGTAVSTPEDAEEPAPAP